MNPIISVIVPIYNVEKYLPKCIESITNQTYTSLQIILVNDGSTDSCGEICDEYALKDDRIIVIHNENSGVASARNSGLEIASGEFLMFVDSDDYISSDAIQVLYDRIIKDNTDMAIAKHIDVFSDGNSNDRFCSWIKDSVITNGDVFSKMADDEFFAVSVCVKMFKKSVFDGIFFPPLLCGEDLCVCLQVVNRCEKISIVNKTIYYYFQRSNSAVHKKTELIIKDEIEATLIAVKFLFENGYEKSACKWYERAVCKAFLCKKKREALMLFNKYFDFEQRKKFCNDFSIKTRVKWFSLYFPFLFFIIKVIKFFKKEDYNG